jgi:hypothetical protein
MFKLVSDVYKVTPNILLEQDKLLKQLSLIIYFKQSKESMAKCGRSLWSLVAALRNERNELLHCLVRRFACSRMFVTVDLGSWNG